MKPAKVIREKDSSKLNGHVSVLTEIVGNYSSVQYIFCETSWNTGFKLPLEIYPSVSLSRPNPGWRSAHVNPFKREDHSKHLMTAGHLTRMPLHCGRRMTYVLELAEHSSFWTTALEHGIPKPCSLFALQPEIQSVQTNSSEYFAVFIFKYLSWGKQDLFISTVAISQWKYKGVTFKVKK